MTRTDIRQHALAGFELDDYIREAIDFLRTHEPPEGYFVGFSGCIVCPFIMGKNTAKVDRHKARWPKFYKVFEAVVTDWYVHCNKKKHLYLGETPQEYINAYYRGFE